MRLGATHLENALTETCSRSRPESPQRGVAARERERDIPHERARVGGCREIAQGTHFVRLTHKVGLRRYFFQIRATVQERISQTRARAGRRTPDKSWRNFCEFGEGSGAEPCGALEASSPQQHRLTRRRCGRRRRKKSPRSLVKGETNFWSLSLSPSRERERERGARARRWTRGACARARRPPGARCTACRARSRRPFVFRIL